VLVYRWRAKALKKLGDKVGADERLVFTGPKSALLYRAGEVLATGLRKSRESFVAPTDEIVSVGMKYDPKLDQAPASREELPGLVGRFGLKERKRATPTASEMKLKEKATF
jgi:hypothetical protein